MAPWRPIHINEQKKRFAYLDAVFPRGSEMPPVEDDWTQPRLDVDGPDDRVWQGWEPILSRHGYELASWPFRLVRRTALPYT